MQVKIKKLHPDAVIPKYAKDNDAGIDLVAVSRDTNSFTGQVTYDTGLAFEIPEGYVGLIFPRSSICNMRLSLSNSVGVIDSGYRGSVKAIFNSEGSWLLDSDSIYDVGDRIAQMIIMPYPQIEFIESDELTTTERGTGGFGSSGT